MANWPTVTDDDGTGLTGTIYNKALTDAMKAYVDQPDGAAYIFNPAEADLDWRVAASGVTNGLVFDAGNSNLTINAAAISAHYDLALAGDGVLCLKETSTPTADANYAKIYSKNTNLLFFQDGAGSEHTILSDVVSDTTPQLGGELDCQANTIGFTQQTATGDGTTTIDWKLGNKFYFTFGAQNDTFTFTAPTHECSLILVLKQDGVGSRTATWPGTVKWPASTAPTLSTGANDVDIVSFYWDGSNYHGVANLDFGVPP